MQESFVQGNIKAIDNDFILIKTSDDNKMLVIEDALRSAFAETIQLMTIGDTIRCNGVTWITDKTFHALNIVYEPNYLLDASALAECFKPYGNSPLYYLYNKLEAKPNNKYFLLGNAANLFLDECIHAENVDDVSYEDVMKKLFQAAPFDLATCPDIQQKEDEYNFFSATKQQLVNIKSTIKDIFPKHQIARDQVFLEPSFVAPSIGLQGRLDLLQIDTNSANIVELKSGKAPFPESNDQLIGINHLTQATIYQSIMQEVLQVNNAALKTYIFYSKYEAPINSLRAVQSQLAFKQEIINIRNQIVANELTIANANNTQTIQNLLAAITAENLIPNNSQSDKFVTKYIVPQIQKFSIPFRKSSELEQKYFYQFYRFLTKEQICAKTGNDLSEGMQSFANAWTKSTETKIQTGDILINLKTSINECNANKPTIQFEITERNDENLPNFRVGDIVMIYERNQETDNITNKQIYRGSIAELTEKYITIRLRAKQRNRALFHEESLFAIEHDAMEATFNAMYRALYGFLSANQDRKDLLLNRRALEFDRNIHPQKKYINEEIDAIVQKAAQAKDLFLLIGPPGTGKTSIALSAMVDHFYSNPDNNILLLSYTNRAVDEICEAISTLDSTIDFVRIGASLSCAEAFRPQLLDTLLENCRNRSEVRELLLSKRVFVGTIASLSNKMELFQLKKFQVAIIDAASQILEPYLLNLFSIKNTNKENGIEKFIFIGDQKQLPAVVLQPEQETRVADVALCEIGLEDCRNSLFERLYNLHKSNDQAVAMLRKQGRMHPDIAAFTNIHFYDNQVSVVPISHQKENLDFRISTELHPLQKIVASKRMHFFETKTSHPYHFKKNQEEAEIITNIVHAIIDLHAANEQQLCPETQIGIIAPYKSQIATIRKELRKLDNAATKNIIIDTVERFQGSQRDIIIYSFCVNTTEQLAQLSSCATVDNIVVDRKLNVALTRARKQLFLVGNRNLLMQNDIYAKLIEFLEA